MMFQLSKEEFENLKSQFATSSWGGRRTLPYAFTEQGVAMLSAVLHSDTAIKVSIQIMKAFVEMRRFLMTNSQVFQRLGNLELKQLETDRKIDSVLNAIESKNSIPQQGIFYDGQIFDAWSFISKIIRSAKKSIVLIDGYIDDTVLGLFARRKKGIGVKFYTKNISNQLKTDIEKFNEQYPPLSVDIFHDSHDRFLIIDEKEVYHIGASLKDMSRKWFAYSKMEMSAVEILNKVTLV
jgi:hypothetical protein